MDERVLVCPTEVFLELGHFVGFQSDVDRYLPTLFKPAHLSFRPRAEVEEDPNFKQLVPYVVLKCQSHVYCYERGKKGSESRLHKLLSLGIGGHVNDEDGAVGREAYDRGVQRELEEEVAISTTMTERIVGLVHDDTTPVGAVHLGVVHLYELESPSVAPLDPAIVSAGFRRLDEVRSLRDRFETWSQFVVDHVLWMNHDSKKTDASANQK
jgi:predicted NUDIX family phosphoesterase